MNPINTVTKKIAKESKISLKQVIATTELLEEGNSIPFITYYRKDQTDNLAEIKIQKVETKFRYYKELSARKELVLNKIEEIGQLTDSLKSEILTCYDKVKLEDLYFSFKFNTHLKVGEKKRVGLTRLAKFILEQKVEGESFKKEFQELLKQNSPEGDSEKFIEATINRLAELISEDPRIRKIVRQLILLEGLLVTKITSKKKSHKKRFAGFHDFRELINKIPLHRLTLIFKGNKDKILNLYFEINEEIVLSRIKQHVIKNAESESAVYLVKAVKASYSNLLKTSIQKEVYLLLKERSDNAELKIIQSNLSNLLLSPPMRDISVIGIQPSIRTDCNVAVINKEGRYLDHFSMFLNSSKKKVEQAETRLFELIQKYHIRVIGIGTGLGARETDSFIKSFLKKYHSNSLNYQAKTEQMLSSHAAIQSKQITKENRNKSIEPSEIKIKQTSKNDELKVLRVPENIRKRVISLIVNKVGSEKYARSKEARIEFPKLDLRVRAAISIGRRLQDPLKELVKIDSKQINLSEFQESLDQNKLTHAIETTFRSSVNFVGVNLNQGSSQLLQYVSGLNKVLASSLVSYREKNGPFVNLKQLIDVPGINKKIFQQAAGFLLIQDGDCPLDQTRVHPEYYEIANNIANSLKLDSKAILANSSKLKRLDVSQFANDHCGIFSLKAIKFELIVSGRDPRKEFILPEFHSNLDTIDNVNKGMVLEGIVTTLTNFGAFVDLGIQQDGLLHISQLSNQFLRHPNEVVHIGEVVRVKVLGVDEKEKRVSLSLKALKEKTVFQTQNKKTAVKTKKPSLTPSKTASSTEVRKSQVKQTKHQEKTQSSFKRSLSKQRRKRTQLNARNPLIKSGRYIMPEVDNTPDISNLSFSEKIKILKEKFEGIH